MGFNKLFTSLGICLLLAGSTASFLQRAGCQSTLEGRNPIKLRAVIATDLVGFDRLQTLLRACLLLGLQHLSSVLSVHPAVERCKIHKVC